MSNSIERARQRNIQASRDAWRSDTSEGKGPFPTAVGSVASSAKAAFEGTDGGDHLSVAKAHLDAAAEYRKAGNHEQAASHMKEARRHLELENA